MATLVHVDHHAVQMREKLTLYKEESEKVRRSCLIWILSLQWIYLSRKISRCVSSVFASGCRPNFTFLARTRYIPK